MPLYIIEQQESAVVLFEGYAADARQALDLYARDAGYRDYSDLCERLYDDIPGAYALDHAEAAGLLIRAASPVAPPAG